MTVHVFIGVGPANLHRALKIQKMDPTAKLVFIDNRLRPKTHDIDRERARANIFRFSTKEVTGQLIADGVRRKDLAPLIYQRKFSVEQGFQSGDERVFTPDDFTQIQIRDLQQVLLDTIVRQGGSSNPPVLVKQTIEGSGDVLEAQVVKLLGEQPQGTPSSISGKDAQNIKIHVATGALTGNEKSDEIVYPDQVTSPMPGATDDVAAMTVTPLHGTATFVITGKITLDQLKEDQRSLDLTNWPPALSKFGWTLIRPPRVRVFYANDILYIGAEIPEHMQGMKKDVFEKAMEAYTRQIASLVFPRLDIGALPVNPHLISRFPTSRGERGVAITTRRGEIPWHSADPDDKATIPTQIDVSYHGDSRYLPHYQTGSGFVTAFQQNELYADIHSCTTFDDLAKCYQKHSPDENAPSGDALREKYLKLVKKDPASTEAQALEACKNELYMALSRDIITHNQEKVGRYLNAIHSQGLRALEGMVAPLIKGFNDDHPDALPLTNKQFDAFHPQQVAVELLRASDVDLLRKALPRLLNMNFSKVSDAEILRIRDLYMVDLDRNLPKTKFVNPDHGPKIQQVITNNQAPFYQQVSALLREPDPAKLAKSLQDLAHAIGDNQTLHKRHAVAFFSGKFIRAIDDFSRQLNEVVAKNKEDPTQLKKQALETITGFYQVLEQGASKRTMQALVKETEALIPSSSLRIADK